jgi:hypothetical protein
VVRVRGDKLPVFPQAFVVCTRMTTPGARSVERFNLQFREVVTGGILEKREMAFNVPCNVRVCERLLIFDRAVFW